MIITIQGTGIELTDAIKAYALKKVTALEKFFNNATKFEIDVGLKSHHHQKGKIFYAECNVHVPGALIRVVKDAEDLYRAIDKVKDHLKVELESTKEKRRAKDKKTIRAKKGYQE
jgi:putative sigma-54 modulation protein